MDDITDADYTHRKRVCKDFETKKLGEYHDFYIQSNTILLADVFENLCLEIDCMLLSYHKHVSE